MDRRLFFFCFSLVALVADSSPAADARKPWTTSKVLGSPEPPPPFKVVRVFPKLRFNNPLLCTFAPGSDRIFVAEQYGKLYSFKPQDGVEHGDLFIDLPKQIATISRTPNAKEVEACYGLVFHPNFAQNRKCYICYTVRKPGEKNLPEGSRVSEFLFRNSDPPTVDPASERIVLTFLQGGHNGGDLHFGPDGFLYISCGDAADPNPPDPFKTGQDCTDFLSSVLRIDVDRRDPGKEYAVPKDNPFLGIPNVRPEIWAFGFRNPWRFSFDRQSGDLWVGDVGWELWEMVDRVVKGGNYGWSIVEARQPINTHLPQGPGPILPPTIELNHSIAASVTGGYVYRGKKFPELVGQYIFGDWETHRLWAATTGKDKPAAYREIADPSVRIVAFGEDHAGELYIVDYDGGGLYTLERNAAGAANLNFPKKLSDTGLFADVKTRKPAEGVIPFAINAEQWADGASSERLLALPNYSRIVWHSKDVPIPGSMFSRQFEFPENAVFARTFIWPKRSVGADRERPIETQILHYDGKQWRGYTYVWNDDGSDALLAPAEGAERQYHVRYTDYLTPRGTRLQKWAIHSRTQCLQCHNGWAQTTLAFNIPQLNGRSLSDLVSLGLFDRRDDKNRPLKGASGIDAKALPRLPGDPQRLYFGGGGAAASLEEFARTYLQVNCAHCHRNGGGGSVTFEVPINLALKDTKTVDVSPMRGDFGMKDARIIAPGDPYRSVLYYRMAKTGSGRMPHLGSEVPDTWGLCLIGAWITSLDPAKKVPAIDKASVRAGPVDIEAKLKSVGGALQIASQLSYGVHEDLYEAILAKAAAIADPNVRDLFAHRQPPERRRPTLGANPNAAAILAMKGDAVRGRELFWNHPTLQCKTCHKIGGEGVSLGPELTRIASQRTRPELLDSVLHPSAKIEPAYTSYIVLTKDGQTNTGLMVKRDAKEVVLKDAKNQEIHISAVEVERVQPTKTSLMPDGVVKDMTAQEAADLLEFLAGLK